MVKGMPQISGACTASGQFKAFTSAARVHERPAFFDHEGDQPEGDEIQHHRHHDLVDVVLALQESGNRSKNSAAHRCCEHHQWDDHSGGRVHPSCVLAAEKQTTVANAASAPV